MAVWMWVGSWPTLAASDTASQLPPVRVKRPLPIRLRISSGVSSGPLANGVKLKNECGYVIRFYVWKLRVQCLLIMRVNVCARSYPASIVYSNTPRLQMSQPSS